MGVSQRTSLQALSALGVASAVLIAILVNVLVGRFYARWDWTPEGEYSLSEVTVNTLRELGAPVEVVVFAGQVDPWRGPIADMLDAYGAESRELRVRYIDPDKNPIEFEALQKKYGIGAGLTEDGTVLTDTRVVVARGGERWYITDDDLVEIDTAAKRARPRLEQALTEGIRNVLNPGEVRVCFTTGHGEASLQEMGAQGLGEFEHTLRKNNYVPVPVDLSPTRSADPLAGCRVVVIPGLGAPFEKGAAQILLNYFQGGGNVLLLSPPLLDEDGRFSASGLEELASVAGIGLGRDLVVETDEALHLPGDVETLVALVRSHAVTSGLQPGTDEGVMLMTGVQSLQLEPGSPARPLLVTSPSAVGVTDVRPFVDSGTAPSEAGETDHAGPLVLVAASELPKVKGSDAAHGPRMVVVGTPTVAFSENWRRPELRGRATLLESAVAWLAVQPELVSIPQKRGYDIGLNLTAEDVTDVQRYVLIYMPLAALVIGAAMVWSRRSGERKSRKAAGSVGS